MFLTECTSKIKFGVANMSVPLFPVKPCFAKNEAGDDPNQFIWQVILTSASVETICGASIVSGFSTTLTVTLTDFVEFSCGTLL